MMYSNCLIEALKAKLKDPKNVHIFFVPKKFGGGATHFMWFNEVTHKYYHSVATDQNCGKNFWHKVWHKQKIKEVDESLFNAFIYKRFCFCKMRERKRIAKKMHLRLARINTDWNRSRPDNQKLPSESDMEFLKAVFKKEPKFKVVTLYSISERDLEILDYETLYNLSKSEDIKWRFLNLFEDDFEEFYANRCSYADAKSLNG